MMADSQTGYSRRSTGFKPRSAELISPSVVGHERLTIWFEKWGKPLRHWIAKACVPSGEVDDLAQEVFLRLLRYSDDVLVENPQGYLFRIATNVVHAWRERCRVRMEHDDVWLEDLQIEASNEPGNAVERAWANRHVWAAVDRLPARQRDALLLHVNEGMTYKQIAETRGLTYRIVLRDLTRAYSTLRTQLISEDL